MFILIIKFVHRYLLMKHNNFLLCVFFATLRVKVLFVVCSAQAHALLVFLDWPFFPECPSSSGKSHLNDVILVNLAYVSKVDTLNERSGTPPPLPSLNFGKVNGHGLLLQQVSVL